MRKLRAIITKYRTRILTLENVVGVGVGYKEVRGRSTGDKAIITFVSKKLAPSELHAGQMVPRSLEGEPTDVQEVGEIRFLARTDMKRPAYPGMSIGHYKITAGTLGAIVKDKSAGEPLILSNNHVLADTTNGRDGRSRIGDPILQPGPRDGGKMENAIATLYRYVPINYRYTGDRLAVGFRAMNNLVDAAVARVKDPNLVNPTILGIGPVRGTADVEVGDLVRKSGRTSGVTQGRVKAKNATFKVDMPHDVYGVFDNQIVADMVSQGGDSGSLVVDRHNNAVGLLFAGSDKVTIFNPIDAVCEALNVTFETKEGSDLQRVNLAAVPFLPFVIGFLLLAEKIRGLQTE